MLMLSTKLNTLILIFNALHFSIKLALKNRKRINDMKDFCNMSVFTHLIALVYSLNVSDNSLSFRKLRVQLIM